MPPYTPDEMIVCKGFLIEIDGGPAGGSDVDSAWESVSGGTLNIEIADASVGHDKFTTHAPGHKSVGEITLRGAMTDKRAALCTWINETVAGKPWKRDVSITPMLQNGTVGPTYIFLDCVLTAYRPPRLVPLPLRDPCDRGPLREEVRFTYRDWTVKA